MAAGRVTTGFSLPYVAEYAAEAGVVTYSNPTKLARGVRGQIEPEVADNNDFYADNVKAESIDGTFTGGTLTLEVDGLLAAAEKLIFGLPDAATVNGITVQQYGDEADPPYLGVGFIYRFMSGGVTTYVPIVLTKVKFNLPTNEAQTQGEEIDWQTQELTGQIMRDDSTNHNWKMVGTATYSTEADAETALKTILGYVAPSGTP